MNSTPYNLITKTEGDSLLKVVAIYGANASGKSNFVDAYRYFLNIVQDSFRKNNKDKEESIIAQCHYPFFFDEESYDADTEFEAVYHLEDNEEVE